MSCESCVYEGLGTVGQESDEFAAPAVTCSTDLEVFCLGVRVEGGEEGDYFGSNFGRAVADEEGCELWDTSGEKEGFDKDFV